MDSFLDLQPAAWSEIVAQMSQDPTFLVINGGSVNGPGSSLEYTRGLRNELPDLLKRYGVTTMVDAPCGDLTWISKTDLSFLYSYIGYDADERIIATVRAGMAQCPRFTFICTNLLKRKRFPKVDLILCRDFLAHLPTEYIEEMLSKFTLSGSTYLLASNYPGVSNEFVYHPDDFPWRGYMERPVDLTAPPFCLRRIEALTEQSPPGGVIAREHELALFTL